MTRFAKLASALAVLVLCAPALFAGDDPTYTALRNARPDGRTYAVNNLTIDRDAYRLTLNGTLHLLAPVDGKSFGAVFLGQGSYTLTPASEVEQHELMLFSGDAKLTTLTDTFDTGIFFDAALLKEAEAKAGAPKNGTPSPEALGAWDEYMKKQRRDLTTNIHVRLLEELLNPNPAPQPLFFGLVKAKQYGVSVLIVDPLGAQNLRLTSSRLGGEQTQLNVIDEKKGGTWYSSHLASEVKKGSATVYPPLARADHYDVDSSIASNGELSGTSTIHFTATSKDVRVLPLYLRGKLRISEAQFAADEPSPKWEPVAYVQEKAEEDSDPAVVFAKPLTLGQKYLLKVTYSGKDVLFNAGDGNYSVGARESWYANLNTFEDLATYDLTFHTPAKFQVISVGSLVSDTTAGDKRTSVWKSEQPIRVAGFNYGKFKKLSQTDADSGFVVDVYTNPGTPDVINNINRYLEARAAQSRYSDDLSEAYVGPDNVRIDTAKLAQSALADGINTARTAKYFYGTLPQKHVSITQQSEWSFGQSWPSLVYLPYIAFLDGTVRNTLGLNDAKDFIDLVGPHEFAHQWWGHNVYARTYHDEWLSEGFAEFTAGLVLQQTGGWPKYNSLYEKKRKFILDRTRYATKPNNEAGPISEGFRAASWQVPEGYTAMIYEKGAYVLHMLRMTMQDTKLKNPDQPFIDMMTDFAQTYAGQNVTTADFQKVVERHLTPTLKVTQDGKLDWFFNQWVYGTAIPKYTSNLQVQDAGNGKYHISGSVTQSEVPDNFFVVMPLYVEFEKGSIVRLGNIGIAGNTTKPVDVELSLPKKPVKVTINAMHDVLAK